MPISKILERSITDGAVTSAKIATSAKFTWDTTVKTSGFTASANTGYFCNTTSAAFTVTLPASPTAGDTIQLLDYAGTFGTNNITLGANGNKIEGGTTNKKLTTNREAVTLTYVDATQGWVASSGTNYGSQSIDPLIYSVDFLVVAGGGGSGAPGNLNTSSGGSGAGGFRTSAGTSGGGASAESSLTFNGGTVYTITVGAGGAGAPAGGNSSFGSGNNGNNSSISGTGITTITSIGGGAGGSGVSGGNSGGSGGGAGSYNNSGSHTQFGSGTANQGFNGAAGDGTQTSSSKGGGGGGAGAAASGVNGGVGVASTITGSSVFYAGGGASTTGTGGNGGGANGVYETSGLSGTANTGGGGGGGFSNSTQAGGSGGSGVVILRMATANYSGTTTGSPTVTTSGSNTIIKFTGSGTYTA